LEPQSATLFDKENRFITPATKKLEQRKKHMSQAQKSTKQALAAVKETETSLPKNITPEQIALRAYQIYEERGDNPGSDVDDWLEAERQLNQTLRNEIDD
jgi:outer membrane protein TolC